MFHVTSYQNGYGQHEGVAATRSEAEALAAKVGRRMGLSAHPVSGVYSGFGCSVRVEPVAAPQEV